MNALGLGDNTKAAVIRLGLMEMVKFAKVFRNFCCYRNFDILQKKALYDV